MADEEIMRLPVTKNVPLFYDPIQYVLTLKGKRIRPLLTLLCAATLDNDYQSARFPAAAVELLHSFTLVHDDIMDNDEIRRGQPTVHIKWDLGTAILAGDGLMGLAFEKLLQTPRGDVASMARRFSKTMRVICEGQGLDKMFESAGDVDRTSYLDMIARKTAVLIELSCELGGMAVEAGSAQIDRLKQFGLALGMGFQVQDDYLDIIAEENALGKKVGSDLTRHKQTILTILLKEKTGIRDLYKLDLQAFRKLLKESAVEEEVVALYTAYFDTAYKALNALPANKNRDLLKTLTEYIQNRSW